MQELDTKEKWFRPLADTVAKRLLGEVSWGVKLRVFIGAGLSVLDLITDVIMLVVYLSYSEQRQFGLMLLAMIACSISLQLLLSMIQTRRKGWRGKMKEFAIVLTGLKPGYDAYKVSSGAKQEEGSVFEPQQEMVAGKLAEVFGEAIPVRARAKRASHQPWLAQLIYSHSPCSLSLIL